MAKTNSIFSGDSAEQSIDQLQRRYQELHKKRIQVETQRDAATKRLNELKAQAREKYGTDDVAALQEQLAGIIRDNAQKRAKYQEDLDNIEKGLAAVETKFSDSGASPGGDGQAKK